MKAGARFVEWMWRRKGPLAWLVSTSLLPLSVLFAGVAGLRRVAYRIGLGRVRKVVPAVVAVGNLTVGGTGKTPTALWLGERLGARGYRVALASRGYGGTSRRPTLVAREAPGTLRASEDWQVVGDETVLLARRFPGPVLVARNRAEAATVAAEVFGADVVVLDDGFQHLRLARDFDLVLVRSGTLRRPRLLPAGPFREPPSALRRADAVLVTKGPEEDGDGSTEAGWKGDFPRSWRGTLRTTGLVTSVDGRWVDVPMGRLVERRALALSGVADPAPFYQTLHEWGATLVDFLEFPDHHVYTLEDWKRIAHRSRMLELVVTTEKDLVKLEQFPFAKGKLVALRVSMEIGKGDDLVDVIDETIRAKRRPSLD